MVRRQSILRTGLVSAVTFSFGYVLMVLNLSVTTIQFVQEESTFYPDPDFKREFKVRDALLFAREQVEVANQQYREYLEDRGLDFSSAFVNAADPEGQSKNETDGNAIGLVRDVLTVKPNYTRPFVSPSDSSCFFVDKISGEGMPDIHSAFIDLVAGYIVFNGLKFLDDTSDTIDYYVDFRDGSSVTCDPVVLDRRNVGFMPQYMLVITCPLAYSFRNSKKAVITFRSSQNNAYPNITVCTSGASLETKKFLAMCTMVRNVDSFIPAWLDVHRFFGVEHVYIYDNEKENATTLPKTIDKWIKDGFVTYIPWSHSVSPWKSYLEVQIAHENDCLWRHRYDAQWMIKIDVDEYIQPMDPKRTKIPDYLRNPLFTDLAGVRISNWFFSRPERIQPEGDAVIQRNRWAAREPTMQQTGHDKNILRPINVHYFKIHNVKLGGDMISMNPYSELRMVHYRYDNKRALHFELPPAHKRDYSMLNILNKVWNTNNKTEQLNKDPGDIVPETPPQQPLPKSDAPDVKSNDNDQRSESSNRSA